MFIKIENLTKKFGEENVLFSRVNLMITDSHRVGLVGKNGTGKTTFLKILNGELRQSLGKIAIDPAKAKIVYHSQTINPDIEFLEKNSQEDSADIDPEIICFEYLLRQNKEFYALWEKINSEDPEIDYLALIEEYTEKGGYNFENKITQALKRLKLKYHQTLSTLSGGQKTRLQLAKLLIEDADILLLDEPTNHLDIDGLEWFYEFIQNFKGIVIIATHDRNLLTRSINKIIEFKDNTITEYSGNYDFYRKEKFQNQASAENKLKANEKMVDRLNLSAKRLQDRIERHEKRAKEIENKNLRVARLEKKNRSTKTKMIQKKLVLYRDNDKLSANFKLDRQADKLGSSRRTILSKARALNPKKRKIGWHMKLQFNTEHIESDYVVKIENLSKSFGDKEILKDFNFELMKNKKAAIVGPNGIGKSTILKCIVGEITDYTGRLHVTNSAKIGYLEQESKDLDYEKSVLENFLASAGHVPQSEARAFLHFFLFEGNMALRKVKTLSEGEKLKLRLARLLYSKANLLLLDEPTNHLDIDSQEVIEKALKDYEGSLILVSHDQVLMENIGINQTIELGKAK